MYDRFSIWKYKDEGGNCWDYVREFIKEHTGVILMTSGVCPDDKENMTKESLKVLCESVECGPIDFAFACHYLQDTLVHVGVVHKERVRHTGRQRGTCSDSIKKFERLCTTKYFIHKDLINGNFNS